LKNSIRTGMTSTSNYAAKGVASFLLTRDQRGNDNLPALSGSSVISAICSFYRANKASQGQRAKRALTGLISSNARNIVLRMASEQKTSGGCGAEGCGDLRLCWSAGFLDPGCSRETRFLSAPFGLRSKRHLFPITLIGCHFEQREKSSPTDGI
jgi:hypothetical protein